MIATFEAVARLGSRAEAAAELNVTLGAVGKQLRALEHWLGVALFTGDLRNGSAMTTEGRRLAMAVTAGLETIQHSISEIAVPHGPPTELRILAPAGLSVNWLLPRLPRFEREAPALRIRIQTTHTGDDWVSFPHDAAIRRDGYVPEGYRRELLFQEKLAACVAPSLRTSGMLRHDLEILPLVESRTRAGDLDRWLAAAGIEEIGFPRQRFSHFYTAYEAAMAAQGVIIVSTILASADLDRGSLRLFHPEVQICGAQHALLIPADSAKSDAVAVFASFLRRMVAETETTVTVCTSMTGGS